MIEAELKSWLVHCKTRFTDRTCDLYEHILGQVDDFIRRDGGQLTPEALEAYLAGLLDRTSRRSYNCHLTAIRSFCKWRAVHYKTDDPAERIHYIKEDPPKQRVLNDDEYQAILGIAQGTDRDIFQFIANTGLRRAEFQALTWADVSHDLSHIRIKGKGRKERVIPLNATCQAILDKYDRQDGPVQFTRRYYGRQGAYWICHKLAKQAGVAHFGPHALRHWFCTKLLRSDVPIYKVSKIMGHASISVTEKVYAHLLPQDLFGVTDVLDQNPLH